VLLFRSHRRACRQAKRLVLEDDVQRVDDAGDVWKDHRSAAVAEERWVWTVMTYNRGWSRGG
jgi:hypothetical protein